MQGPEESAANPTPETACIVGSLAVVDASLVAHSGAAGLAVAAGAGRPGAPGASGRACTSACNL